jgi:hypothetical protein
VRSTQEREVEDWFERIEQHLEMVAASQQGHAKAMAEVDDRLTKLAAAQIVKEQKLQGSMEALRRRGYGSK